jgi:hypothetical protein
MSLFVERDASGKISGLYANPQEYATEELPDDSPEVVAFLAGPTPEQRLEATRAVALDTLLTRDDLTGVQVRAVVSAVVFLINNRLEALGQQRVLEAEILQFIAANPTVGDPAGGM